MAASSNETASSSRARVAGFIVLHGEGVEFGGEEFAYAPIGAALRGLPQAWTAEALQALPREPRGELAALLPRFRLEGTPPAEGRFSSRFGQGRLYELVLDLLGRLASEQAPVLVVLEDLHWSDRSSRDFLAFFARNLRAARIALAVTYRTDELQSEHPLRRLLAELARRPTVVRVELGPLSRTDVGRQLEAIEGRPVPAALADQLHARAGGNPFFVEELFAAHREGRADEVPATIADAVLARVERLGDLREPLLPTVAAAGGRIGYDLLERVAPAAKLSAALRAAFDAGILVREQGDRTVAFRHGLISEVIYGRLLPSERTELHRRIARGLAQAPGAPIAQLAHQWHPRAHTRTRSPPP